MEHLGILVLMIDPIPGVSGAACHLPELDAVLINRSESPGRRHNDLARGLFHILTWDMMPPERVEGSGSKSSGRVVQLADNFATAVLMPRPVLRRFGDWNAIDETALTDRLNAVAEELGVSSEALRRRLVATKALSGGVAGRVDAGLPWGTGRIAPTHDDVPLFSRAFVERLALGINDGRISARIAAKAVDLPLHDIGTLCAEHGVDLAIEL